MTMQDRKYPHLTANFFKGTSAGQIKSIYRSRATHPDKIADFRAAIACGILSSGKRNSPRQSSRWRRN
jgi:hypothetical protein